MIVLAITVVIAILGTPGGDEYRRSHQLCYGPGQGNAEIMGALHGKYATPHMGIWVMVAVCAIIGSLGLIDGTVTLTGITLARTSGRSCFTR